MSRFVTEPDHVFETPPVKNRFVYVWRIYVKLISFALFGAGAFVLTITAIPVMKLIWWNKDEFKKHGHHLVSRLFRFFVWFMTVHRAIELTVDKKEELKSLKGAIVVANHPSILDVVMLIALIPDADCIVNAGLKKNIMGRVVANLYITNDVEHSVLVQKCTESLSKGNVLIIFPEGTRSKPQGQNQYKKGAARIALASGAPVVPVFMGGNDKLGLRKKDPMLLFNHTDKYRYHFYVKEKIDPAQFKDLPEPAAAKRIMEKVQQVLCYENNWNFVIGKNPLKN